MRPSEEAMERKGERLVERRIVCSIKRALRETHDRMGGASPRNARRNYPFVLARFKSTFVAFFFGFLFNSG